MVRDDISLPLDSLEASLFRIDPRESSYLHLYHHHLTYEDTFRFPPLTDPLTAPQASPAPVHPAPPTPPSSPTYSPSPP